MNLWDICFIASFTFLAIAAIVLVVRLIIKSINREKKYVISTSVLCALFVVLSAVSWFFVAYYSKFSGAATLKDAAVGVVLAIARAIQHTMRLFSGDDKYETIVNNLPAFGIEQHQAGYAAVGDVLFLIAPLFTFLFIFSFFKNLRNYISYKRKFCRDAHIFSELNERSLALAKSIRKKKNDSIVFADILDKNEEAHLDLVDGAKEIGAILFRRDLKSIDFNNWPIFRWKKRELNFYLISEDESEKIRHAESVIASYKNVKNTNLYYFSDSMGSIEFLNSFNETRNSWSLKVIRVNDIRALVYQNLSVHGIELFENANDLPNGMREISAVVVGLGKYGIEVLKSLIWYTQIPGYRVKITAFDKNEKAADIFKAACPEIKVNEASVDETGDARYTVNICNDTFGTESFYKKLADIRDVTYLFICLGTDNQNITAATGIHNRLLREGIEPVIETVVYDSSLKNCICGNFEKQNIRLIGDLDSFYSVGTVINSKLIGKGLEVHDRWWNGEKSGKAYENNVSAFYMNDYNFYSSLASALHRMLREKITIYAETKNDECEKVFPFYYSEAIEANQIGFDGDMKVLREILPRVNDNVSVMQLSDEIKGVSSLVYIKIANLEYQKLSDESRKVVCEKLKNKYPEFDTSVIENDEKYLECIEAFADDAESKKIFEKIYDFIVEVKTQGMQKAEKIKYLKSLEYDVRKDKEQIAGYIKRVKNVPDDEGLDIRQYIEKAKCFAFIEHIRWNAYMRTEGFSFAEMSRKEFKLHFNLVPVNDLTFADCVKDI